MKKTNLANLLETVSLQDLQKMVLTKGKLDSLEKKKTDLEKSLAAVNKQIDSLQGSLGKTGARGPGRPKGKPTKKKVKRTRKRIAQPSLSSVIVEILKEKKKPLKVNEIHDAVLKEKGYKTKAKNFKANLRIMLYTNKKGLFKKVKPGLFGLAAEKKKATVKKKTVAKKKR